MGEALAAACLERLRAGQATVATAESLTAGLICATLAAIPGASDVLRGGVLAYASDLKVTLLGVDPEIVRRDGVVSAACAQAMAQGVRARLGATWGVAATGVAGPATQEGKPVGTVFVAVAGPSLTEVSRLDPASDQPSGRAAIREAAVDAALALLLGGVAG